MQLSGFLCMHLEVSNLSPSSRYLLLKTIPRDCALLTVSLFAIFFLPPIVRTFFWLTDSTKCHQIRHEDCQYICLDFPRISLPYPHFQQID